jgi:hypothetical protein
LRRLIAPTALALAALMLAACDGETPVDMKDPAAVARKFAEAYNARNLTRMLPLVDQVNLDAVKDALAGGPESEAYRGIFSPEMVDLMAREAGKIEGPRYDGNDAVVKVAKSERGDVYTIVLDEHEDGDWLIEEFATLTEQEFRDLAEKPKD